MKFYFTFFLSFVSILLSAQVGIGTTTPNTKSMLDISSTSDNGTTYKGLMPPRVPTVIDRDAINPGFQDFGLLVFVEEIGSLQIWDGDSWENITTITIAAPEVWINEIHYDNQGTDMNEGFEIAGEVGTDLSDYAVYRYNGNDGNLYQTVINFTEIIPDQSNGYGTIAITLPTNSLQNDIEGIALVKISTGNVIQFISYEGSFIANNGPAMGQTSVDIMVSVSNATTPVGSSLQLTGLGNEYSEFSWTGPAPATFNTFNTGQTINN